MKPIGSKGFVLITGASSGIGKALAFEFARHGFDLVLVALPGSGLPQVLEQLQSYPITTHGYEANLLRQDECAKILSWCRDRRLRIAGLVNNVGIGSLEPFEQTGISSILEMIDLNIRVAVLLSRLFIPELKKSPRSYIMNVGSMASEMPIPDKAIYLATKAFIKQFSACLHTELSSYGIHVCCLCPGSTFTSLHVQSMITRCGILPGPFCKQPEFVARHAVAGMFKLNRIIVPGFVNQIALILYSIIPYALKQRIFLFIFRKKQAHPSMVLMPSKLH